MSMCQLDREDSTNELLFVGFNQDYGHHLTSNHTIPFLFYLILSVVVVYNAWVFLLSIGCFACGTNTGFRIYNCDPFKETFKRGTSCPSSIVG
jgi:hypothetical protein